MMDRFESSDPPVDESAESDVDVETIFDNDLAMEDFGVESIKQIGRPQLQNPTQLSDNEEDICSASGKEIY